MTSAQFIHRPTRIKYVLAGLAVVSSCLIFNGVSAQEQSKYSELNSGFLKGKYDLLQDDRSASGVPVKRWVSPKLKQRIESGEFRQVLVSDVVLYPEPRPTTQVPLNTLRESVVYLTKALQQEIAMAMPVTKKMQSGTLKLSVAITAVGAQTQGLKVRELIPIALVFAAAKAATGNRGKEATIALEWKLQDSAGELLAMGVRQGVGSELKKPEGSDDDAVVRFENLKPILTDWSNEVGKSFGNIVIAQSKAQ